MEIKLNFKGPLQEKLGQFKIVNLDSSKMTLLQFIEHISKFEWSNDLIENNHIKSPTILIIDDQLIKTDNYANLIIDEDSVITFHVMFAGG